MNNQIPFFNPFNQIPVQSFNQNELEKLTNKIDRLEKNLRILENRVNKLEKKDDNNHYYNEDPSDMYMI